MSTIYCWVESAPGWGPMDVHVQAIAEDGEVLAGHLSSSVEWAKIDIKHESKLKKYEEKYPGGYTLEWVDDVEGHVGIKKAFMRNRHRWFNSLLNKRKTRDEAYEIVWGWKSQ